MIHLKNNFILIDIFFHDTLIKITSQVHIKVNIHVSLVFKTIYNTFFIQMVVLLTEQNGQ